MQRVTALIAALLASVPLAAAARSADWVPVRIEQPFAPYVDRGAAEALADDVNAARADVGLPPLALDPQLSRFALALAEQMAHRHYIGHTDPDGVTFSDRIQAAGLLRHFAAENIALDVDEPHADAALLHSPGHYANIMDARARRLGVAAVAAGTGEVFFVEEFAG
jgi:uncharacterized protein YkwD